MRARDEGRRVGLGLEAGKLTARVLLGVWSMQVAHRHSGRAIVNAARSP